MNWLDLVNLAMDAESSYILTHEQNASSSSHSIWEWYFEINSSQKISFIINRSNDQNEDINIELYGISSSDTYQSSNFSKWNHDDSEFKAEGYRTLRIRTKLLAGLSNYSITVSKVSGDSSSNVLMISILWIVSIAFVITMLTIMIYFVRLKLRKRPGHNQSLYIDPIYNIEKTLSLNRADFFMLKMEK